MAHQSFFTEPHVDALMGSMLDLAGETLLLAARQRRLEEPPKPVEPSSSVDPAGRVALSAPLDPAERVWVAQRADELVAAWLAPFTRAGQPGDGGSPHAA